jgi:hypothetical protein
MTVVTQEQIAHLLTLHTVSVVRCSAQGQGLPAEQGLGLGLLVQAGTGLGLLTFIQELETIIQVLQPQLALIFLTLNGTSTLQELWVIQPIHQALGVSLMLSGTSVLLQELWVGADGQMVIGVPTVRMAHATKRARL